MAGLGDLAVFRQVQVFFSTGFKVAYPRQPPVIINQDHQLYSLLLYFNCMSINQEVRGKYTSMGPGENDPQVFSSRNKRPSPQNPEFNTKPATREKPVLGSYTLIFYVIFYVFNFCYLLLFIFHPIFFFFKIPRKTQTRQVTSQFLRDFYPIRGV